MELVPNLETAALNVEKLDPLIVLTVFTKVLSVEILEVFWNTIVLNVETLLLF